MSAASRLLELLLRFMLPQLDSFLFRDPDTGDESRGRASAGSGHLHIGDIEKYIGEAVQPWRRPLLGSYHKG